MGTVKYLLDTHTLLWATRDEEKLGNKVLSIINEINAPVFVSAVSAYEIMYKHRIGKLPEYEYFAKNYFDILNGFGVIELPISAKHAHFAGKIEWAHRDPFDRLLAAQAFVDNMILITNDPVFQKLPWVTVLW
ncbi:MAG: type II toxin-antitoxin system VapC family toxin [Oscillospiraceae bacterium]|nr:type II toxin-antitoxin system VapC family toxin [Oscillospiraceae bacterium]